MDHLRDVPERLRDAAKLFEERNKSYGGNYTMFGHVLAAMFPDGIRVHGPEEMQRLLLLCLQVTKITRYARNLGKGGHADSAEDGAVYWLMMAEQDDRWAAERGGSLGSQYETCTMTSDPPEASVNDEWWRSLPSNTQTMLRHNASHWRR